jgi:hypothetical protein
VRTVVDEGLGYAAAAFSPINPRIAVIASATARSRIARDFCSLV